MAIRSAGVAAHADDFTRAVGWPLLTMPSSRTVSGLGGVAGHGQREARRDRRVVLGHVDREVVEAAVGRGDVYGVAPAQQAAQHVFDPGAAVAALLPAGVGEAEPFELLLVDRVEGRPGGAQHREAEERPGHLDQAQPTLVVEVPAEPFSHRVASRLGTTKTTATGNRCGRGSR
ncbi:hypothetical protein [Sphaerimonospora thailandensis]|nr:hypothetical protein [Sphaerimonospora thailandensis]